MPYYEVRTLKDIGKDENGEYKFDIFEDDENEDEFKTGWDNFLPIDYQKLRKYFQIQIVVRVLEEGSSQFVIAPFRRCTEEDFRNNGYMNEDLPIALDKIICPETDIIKDIYRIKNGY